MSKVLNNITYLLGAGASANALPMVQNVPDKLGYNDSLRSLSDKLKTDSSIASNNKAISITICENLEWLAERAQRAGSVDTFAKYCSHKEPESLERLKFTLSVYFTVKQFIEKRIDTRYLQFITKLLNSKDEFPDNIKILNWNYDFQIQLACEEYRKEEFHQGVNNFRHTPPLVPYYPPLGNYRGRGASEQYIGYSMVHLNGIAGFYLYAQTENILNYFLNGQLSTLDNLFAKIQHDQEFKYPLLGFSFETNTTNTYLRRNIDYALPIVKDTDYLVVIGYSFPYDNVDTDRKIFDAFDKERLKGIYIQNPNTNGEHLREDFDLGEQVFIKHLASVDNFYLPREAKLFRKELKSEMEKVNKN